MSTNTSRVELRLVGEAELPALLPLIADYHAFEDVASTAVEREAAARMLLAHPEFGGLWLVLDDGRVAGYIALCRGFSIEFNGFDAFVDEFNSRPGFAAAASARACSSWFAARRAPATSARCTSRSRAITRRRARCIARPASKRATSTC